METWPPEVLANIAICLLHQTNYLLDQLLRRLETDFVAKGGLRERMTRARLNHRENRVHSALDTVCDHSEAFFFSKRPMHIIFP